MSEVTYFDYCLSQCRPQGIKSVCEIAQTRKELRDIAEFHSSITKKITSDQLLFSSVDNWLQNRTEFRNLDDDALVVYKRFNNAFHNITGNDYEGLFDCMVDFLWLFASICSSHNHEKVALLSCVSEMNVVIKRNLGDYYHCAKDEHSECLYIEEAIAARKQFFTGSYPFQYEESRKYLDSKYNTNDLNVLMRDRILDSDRNLSLFFGLTATAVLALNIKRGLCK